MVRKKPPGKNVADASAIPSLWEQASQVEPREFRWLLPQRMIQGSIAIVEGDTSVGKSTFIAAIVAAVTTGQEFLGRHAQAPRSVLWASGEEDFSSQIKPRLVAAGADLDKVHVPALTETGEPIRISLPESVSILRDVCWERDIDLLVLEPLSSMVSATTDLNNVVSVRSCLDPLQRMLFATGVTAIITRGLRKDRSGARTAHGQGSSAIGDTARSILCIEAPNPKTNVRVAHTVKCPRAGRTPALQFQIVGGVFGPLIEGWTELTTTQEVDADSGNDPGERCVREDARNLLRKMLATGWVRSLTVRQAAEDAMVSIATLRRAAADLAVQTRQSWDGQSSYHEWGAPEGGWEQEGAPKDPGEQEGKPAKKPRKRRKSE